jgi:AcrR family transcriptional regulator
MASISTLHIAREAGVSTATIYRWWPTQEVLLLDSYLFAADLRMIIPNEGSPLDRMRKYILQVGHFFTGENGVAAARLLGAIQDNPVLREEFQVRVYAPKKKELQVLVQEAVDAHQLPVGIDTDAFLDCILGPLLIRLMMRHERIDDVFVSSIFDQVVAGANAK